MKEFIHTFGLQTVISEPQKKALEDAFSQSSYYNHTDEVFVLSKYVNQGVRIEIKYRTAKEKRYEKKHRDFNVRIMVTPAKLLYLEQPMSRLYSAREYMRACQKLQYIIKEIRCESGVDLWDEVKIKRIDVTKDVETESARYSQTVIHMAKKALCKTGYHIWIPTSEDICKRGWR